LTQGELYIRIKEESGALIADRIRTTRVNPEPEVPIPRRLPFPPFALIAPPFDDREPVPARKKHPRTDEVNWQELSIEDRPIEAIRELTVAVNDNREIHASERGRRFRIDNGAAVLQMGGTQWQVSSGSEFYIPFGDVALLTNDGAVDLRFQELVMVDLS
jgi:mannose-6-phosphate isomerase-like protein (cupin superfamily)